MNKIVVGNAPSPNLVTAQSRIGSLSNTQHKVINNNIFSRNPPWRQSYFQPGGGKVKIENRKLEWNAQPRTKMVNENYTPGGGDKKVRMTMIHVIADTWQMDVLSARDFSEILNMFVHAIK